MIKQPQAARPPRTLGITLAIAFNSLLYGIVPLLFVIFVRINQVRQAQTGMMAGLGQDTLLGMGVFAITPQELILWGALALGYLLVMVLAWWGKPPVIRYVALWGTLFALLAYTALILYRLRMNSLLRTQSGSFWSEDLFAPALTCSFLYGLILTLYTLWYLNRAPARAFYRGYYLVEGDEQTPSP